MTEDVTRRLADFAVEVKFSDLPQAQVDKTKQLFLDAIGCGLAGYIIDRARIATGMVQDFGGNPMATVIGGQRTSCDLAAFANGELINALDYDHLGPITAHVGPYVIPSCLAIAEYVHASGKELIMALALAHEIGGRVVSSIAGHKLPKDEPPYFEESPRFSYSPTVFGGVAGAGKLLGLDAGKMLNAFGIAGPSTPILGGVKWEHVTGPSIMTKYNAWSGWVARLATVSAWLADKGFTGDTTILDDSELGFWKIVGSPFFKVDNILGGLGEQWHINEIRIKPYPTCGLTHTGIDGVYKLVQENKINPEKIERIVVKGDPLLLTPNREGNRIAVSTDMQFINACIFAVAAYYGDRPSPAWQMPAIYNDPKIMKLAEKVQVELHPRADELMSRKLKEGKLAAFWDVVVEITAAGKKFTTEISEPKGSPTHPMTEKEFLNKFRTNASYSPVSSKKVEEIIDVIGRLEKLDDVTKLTRLLSAG